MSLRGIKIILLGWILKWLFHGWDMEIDVETEDDPIDDIVYVKSVNIDLQYPEETYNSVQDFMDSL